MSITYNPIYNEAGNAVVAIQLIKDKKVIETRELVVMSTLTAGISAVQAQDDALSLIYAQMNDQTKALNSVNDALQYLNSLKQLLQDNIADINDRPVIFTASDRASIQQALDLYNTVNPNAKITMPDPLTHKKSFEINTLLWNINMGSLTADQQNAFKAGRETLYKTIVYESSAYFKISPSVVQNLQKLVKDYGLQLGGVDITKALTIEQINTLQANLSTTQGSVGALNEDLSLKLNQAASQRSAIFAQLQTLLQTMMQTMQQLSRMN